MVTVIAILVILITAGVKLMNGTGPQSRKTGSDMLLGMIEQARTSAITSRCYVILAVAEPGDLPSGDERCRLGLFKVAMEDWPKNGNDITKAVLLSRWRPLDTGIALIGGAVDGVVNPIDEGSELSITYGAKPVTLKVHALAFNSRGGLQFPAGSGPVAMRVAEGNYQKGEPKPFKHGEAQTISENRIKIGRLVGRPYRIDG